MDWIVENDIFVKMHLEANETVHAISNCLSGFDTYSLYIRGSILEEEYPHPKADIDVCLIHNGYRVDPVIPHRIISSLEHFGRPVDLHILPAKSLSRDLPNRLLLYTRSIYIAGPVIDFEPVRSDRHMVGVHWEAYNFKFAPDIMYSTVRSRVCALKNLTRCFGLIRFIETGKFTRNIKECMAYAEKLDKKAHLALLENWAVVDLRNPMYLSNVKEFLAEYTNTDLRRHVHVCKYSNS